MNNLTMNDVEITTYDDIVRDILTYGIKKVALVPCNINVKSSEYLDFRTIFSIQMLDRFVDICIRHSCTRELGMRPTFYTIKSQYPKDGDE